MSKQAGYLYLFRAPVCPFETSAIEVDVRWDKQVGSDIGLLFGIVGNFDEYYLLDVNTDHKAMAVLRRDSSGLRLITPIFYNIPLNRNGLPANHLKVNRDGQGVTVYVNGDSINLYPWGVNWSGPTYAGFAFSPYSNEPVADARFDNFRVTGVSNVEVTILHQPDATNDTRPIASSYPIDLTATTSFVSPWAQTSKPK